MNTVFVQFARVSIILLMLVMQSTMISHAYEHDYTESEQTEHCSTCIAADNNSATSGTGNPQINSVDFVYFWAKLTTQSFIEIRLVNHLSRAPPPPHFLSK